MMILVVRKHADLHTELYQHPQKHFPIAERISKLPQHMLVDCRHLPMMVLYGLPNKN